MSYKYVDTGSFMDIGHWKYPFEFDINEWFGFIYRVIDTTNNKEYIGKKQFWSSHRKIVKGRVNRKIVRKESDWKTYTSSSSHVNKAILEKGIDKFIFIIESLRMTKGSLHYAEVEYQIKEDVLRAKFDNGDRRFYNGMLANMKFLPPVEHSEETKKKISAANRGTFIGRYAGEKNPGFGKNPFRNMSVDQLNEHKKKLSARMSGKNNPMWGKPHYYAKTETEIQQWKDNISKGAKGKPKSDATKERMRKPKGPQLTATCPHCNKVGGKSNMTRFHFDKCKLKQL